jgi:hypothetical protein
MNRLGRPLILLTLSWLTVGFAVLAAQDLMTVDATMQPSPPPRGRGPFPGSASQGHSAGLPIRLDLLIPTIQLRPDGTVLVDFVITNVGTEPIILPSSVTQNIEQQTSVLTLWLTFDAIRGQFVKDQQTVRLFKVEAVGTSATVRPQRQSSDFQRACSEQVHSGARFLARSFESGNPFDHCAH